MTAAKRYLLTEKAVPFVRGGEFSFRIRFDQPTETGRVILRRDKCPIITINEGNVVQTTNVTAQKMLERFIVPQNTIRNGQKHEEGNIFEDVTGSQEDFDLDLDPIFESVER